MGSQRESCSNFGRYVMSMCYGFLRKLGGACTLIEFSYNNSFQSSIGMAPYEALYGRPCRSPMCWMESGEASLIGAELVQETTDGSTK